ncbi:MAG: hypothetical protein VB817_12280, partial [Pirellulaceae bacterium]
GKVLGQTAAPVYNRPRFPGEKVKKKQAPVHRDRNPPTETGRGTIQDHYPVTHSFLSLYRTIWSMALNEVSH